MPELTFNPNDLFAKSFYDALLKRFGEKLTWQMMDAAWYADKVADPYMVTKEQKQPLIDEQEVLIQRQKKGEISWKEMESLNAEIIARFEAMCQTYREVLKDAFRKELRKRIGSKIEDLSESQIENAAYYSSFLLSYYGEYLAIKQPQSKN